MMRKSCTLLGCLVLLAISFVLPASAQTMGRRALSSRAASVAAHLQPIRYFEQTNHLDLVIALPLHNQAVLTNLLKQLYDPTTTNFHRWLTPDDFTKQFGPTEDDYQKVVNFAAAHGLKVTHTHANRLLLDVSGQVADIQNAFQVKLRVYQHPTENRTFYSPDAAPSVETNVPVLSVDGLDNYELPYRLGSDIKPVSLSTNQGVTAYTTGSGPGGDFTGSDFRAAYVPGVTNTGTGQYIAIVDVGGAYYTNDIYLYEKNAGLSTVVSNILLDGSSGIPVGTNADDGEETLDIDMTMSMAPGAVILNYEGGDNDVFNQIAIDDKAKQMTLSYGFGINEGILQIFQEFAAQGQSFSQASGDGGADPNGGTGLTGNPYATIVGGTDLTTAGDGGAWVSETAWSGSGGGISGYGLPDWQQGIATSANQGSTIYRNFPDVAMLADPTIWWYFKNGQGSTVGGTSAASPLWAGFMALVNQRAAVAGKPSAGFVNPAIYALGKGSYTTYTNCFHDLTVGNTFNSQNPKRFSAGVGYDLCTGWGTPTGSNTINFLAGIGTNDFMVYVLQPGLTLVPGSAAASVIQVVPMNGFTGNVALSISGLPPGVTATISTLSLANASAMSLSLSNVMTPGKYVLTLTATSGSLVHTMPLDLTVEAPIPGAAQVALTSLFNRAGIYTEKKAFGTGLDGGGYAYSANQLGSSINWNGVAFNLGPSNALDAISCAGQTVTLPAGNFSTLLLLGTAVDGSQSSQTFTVTYTDDTTTNISQNLSDWAGPQNFSGESVVFNMPYRDINNGTQDTATAVNLYGYSLTLNQTKTVKSITLPNNSDVEILAMAVANTPASAALSAYYNRAGMYTDNTTFTNPATGGIDGVGDAYSATLLGSTYFWNGVQFNFGPANITNVISGTGQTLNLPKGNYWALQMLATGVEGDQANQSFVVTYADNSTTTFIQGLSDWYTPANYAGESNVFSGYRDESNGTQDNRTFYLYGYSFKLNSGKVIQSIKLPNNQNVEVLAISLIPDWPPEFITTPFAGPVIMAGQAYSGTVATNATDLNGDAITYAKVSGPAWLNVAANGTLSGMPLSTNAGANTFVISAADPGGLFTDGTLNITVTSAPPVVSTMSFQDGTLQLNWSGGISPYQVQMTTNLVNPNWQNVGGTMTSGTLSITPTNGATFYRIKGQ
jgi:hypothetical protein